MNLNLIFFLIIFLFLISIFGLFLSRKNFLLILICIEMMLLSITLGFLIFSIQVDDLLGQLNIIFILSIGGAESSIGLAIVVIFYRLHAEINIDNINLIKA
jgi:NADH-quinone oxidoreductase subunit K